MVRPFRAVAEVLGAPLRCARRAADEAGRGAYEPGGPPLVPVDVRVHLAHAVVQSVADGASVDVLHIKGPAAAQAGRPAGRASVDADVLVRPSHLARFTAALGSAGWRQVTPLATAGRVEHSTNWFHGQVGQLDVHVRFPGIGLDAESAFGLMWRGRDEAEIAHRVCTVPAASVHRLILLLHAARDPRGRAGDVAAVWGDAPDAARTVLRELAARFDADVALAAAIGELDRFVDRPEYGLWRLYTDGRSTLAGLERVRAEVGAGGAKGLVGYLGVLRHGTYIAAHMRDRLRAQLGRPPSVGELLGAYRVFVLRALGLLDGHGRRRRDDRDGDDSRGVGGRNAPC